MLESVAMNATLAPEVEAAQLKEVPFTRNTRFLFSVLHSRSWEHFLYNVPSITDFRYTNEALLGVILDDNFMPITIMQGSMGFLKGGSVVKKEFPLPFGLGGVPGLADLAAGIVDVDDLYIANDAGPSYSELGKGPIYEWVNFDEVGNECSPEFKDTSGSVVFTNYRTEVSDIQDVARVIFEGPSNLAEWYFPMRLTVDMIAALLPFGKKYGLNYMHGSRVGSLPKIEFLAEEGPMRYSIGGIQLPEERINGYNHLDVLTAAADRPAHRRNDVFERLINFLRENSMTSARKPAAPGKRIDRKRSLLKAKKNKK